MAADIPTHEPSTIVAGDTVKWTRRLVDYSAADGWILKYAFRGASVIDAEATTDTDGIGYAVTLTASTTATATAGQYEWIAWVELSGENFTVLSGSLTVTPNLKQAVEGDRVSSAETELALVEAQIADLLASSTESYSIGQRSVQKRALSELYVTRGILIAKLGRQRGQPYPTHAVRFSASR